MRVLAGRIVALCAAGAVVGLASCGGSDPSGVPADAVAKVGDHVIGRATLAHWARVEGYLANEANPYTVNPLWVMPEPPAYTACIAQSEMDASKSTHTSSTPEAQGKRRCEQSYQELQKKALSFLLEALWSEGKAAEQGITVTPSELEQELQSFTRREYPGPNDLQRHLAYARMNMSDELLRVRKNMFELRLRQKLEREFRAASGHGTRDRELQSKLLIGSRGKWLAKTSCRPGYLVLFCRQYRGPQQL
jgi:hypothetical protein